MSELLQIQTQIDLAAARVAHLERALAENPGYPSIAANLRAAERILEKLRVQFIEATAELGLEVCRYRAFNDLETTKPASAFDAITGFQRLFSVVYAAKKFGIKQRASVPDGVAQNTQFDFGYAFAGSVGVVLTLRNDRDLFGDSMIDESIGSIFEMAKATNPDQILKYAETIGPGPINALYQWASQNVETNQGADIQWRHGEEVLKSLFVQRQEFWRLTRAIEKSSSEKTERLKITGVLQMADATKLRFKFQENNLPEIRGTVEQGVIDAKHTVGLPRPYVATIIKTTRTRFSTGVEKVKYLLVKLQPIEKE